MQKNYFNQKSHKNTNKLFSFQIIQHINPPHQRNQNSILADVSTEDITHLNVCNCHSHSELLFLTTGAQGPTFFFYLGLPSMTFQVSLKSNCQILFSSYGASRNTSNVIQTDRAELQFSITYLQMKRRFIRGALWQVSSWKSQAAEGPSPSLGVPVSDQTEAEQS